MAEVNTDIVIRYSLQGVDAIDAVNKRQQQASKEYTKIHAAELKAQTVNHANELKRQTATEQVAFKERQDIRKREHVENQSLIKATTATDLAAIKTRGEASLLESKNTLEQKKLESAERINLVKTQTEKEIQAEKNKNQLLIAENKNTLAKDVSAAKTAAQERIQAENMAFRKSQAEGKQAQKQKLEEAKLAAKQIAQEESLLNKKHLDGFRTTQQLEEQYHKTKTSKIIAEEDRLITLKKKYIQDGLHATTKAEADEIKLSERRVSEEIRGLDDILRKKKEVAEQGAGAILGRMGIGRNLTSMFGVGLGELGLGAGLGAEIAMTGRMAVEGTKIVKILGDEETAFKAAGVELKMLNREMGDANSQAEGLSDRWNVFSDRTREVQTYVAQLGHVTGDSNRKITELSVAVEEATKNFGEGAISAEQFAKVFNVSDPEREVYLGRLKMKYRDLADALGEAKNTGEALAVAEKYLASTEAELDERGKSQADSWEKLTNQWKEAKRGVELGLGDALLSLVHAGQEYSDTFLYAKESTDAFNKTLVVSPEEQHYLDYLKQFSYQFKHFKDDIYGANPDAFKRAMSMDQNWEQIFGKAVDVPDFITPKVKEHTGRGEDPMAEYRKRWELRAEMFKKNYEDNEKARKSDYEDEVAFLQLSSTREAQSIEVEVQDKKEASREIYNSKKTYLEAERDTAKLTYTEQSQEYRKLNQEIANLDFERSLQVKREGQEDIRAEEEKSKKLETFRKTLEDRRAALIQNKFSREFEQENLKYNRELEDAKGHADLIEIVQQEHEQRMQQISSDSAEAQRKSAEEAMGAVKSLTDEIFKNAKDGWKNWGPVLASGIDFLGKMAMKEQRGTPANLGAVLGSYEEGTDDVPETGMYKLHKGEKVTPAKFNVPNLYAEIIARTAPEDLREKGRKGREQDRKHGGLKDAGLLDPINYINPVSGGIKHALQHGVTSGIKALIKETVEDLGKETVEDLIADTGEYKSGAKYPISTAGSAQYVPKVQYHSDGGILNKPVFSQGHIAGEVPEIITPLDRIVPLFAEAVELGMNKAKITEHVIDPPNKNAPGFQRGLRPSGSDANPFPEDPDAKVGKAASLQSMKGLVGQIPQMMDRKASVTQKVGGVLSSLSPMLSLVPGLGPVAGLLGGVLGSFEKGTPYVPRTGTYMLHEGERVTSRTGSAGGPLELHPNTIQAFAKAIGGINITTKTSSFREGLAEANNSTNNWN